MIACAAHRRSLTHHPPPGQVPLVEGAERTDLEVALLYARAMRHAGERAKALAVLRRILSVQPGNAAAASEVAGLASAVRDWEAAEAVLRCVV